MAFAGFREYFINVNKQAWGQVQDIVLESKYKYITIWQVQAQVQVQDLDRVLESKYKHFWSSTSTFGEHIQKVYRFKLNKSWFQ